LRVNNVRQRTEGGKGEFSKRDERKILKNQPNTTPNLRRGKEKEKLRRDVVYTGPIPQD